MTNPLIKDHINQQGLKSKIIKISAFIIFLLLFLEIASFFAGRFLENRLMIFYKPIINYEQFDENYSQYMSSRHDVLGWPYKSWNSEKRDETGSRIVPSFPDPQAYDSCISLYGDSFTWGSGVAHEDTWGNILSELAGCRVSNYGQPAYGTDQSYLRYKVNSNDNAEIVILGHLSDDILRNVSQSYDFIVPSSFSGFRYKPRFVLEKDQIQLIPLPRFSKEEQLKAILYPELYLPHEYFVPGGKAKTMRLEFPYSLSMVKALIQNPLFHSVLSGEPYTKKFYKDTHESEALEITSQIIESFDNLVKTRGKNPIVIVFPDLDDIRYYKKNNVWVYQNLINNFSEADIVVINIGEILIDSYEGPDIEELYFTDPSVRGHFNEKGNKKIAEIMYEYLKSNSYL